MWFARFMYLSLSRAASVSFAILPIEFLRRLCRKPTPLDGKQIKAAAITHRRLHLRPLEGVELG